ncbi:hypothetical protein AGMMS49938_00080 [Fibrobacterales bacterium]|nr:hypothetical protein AGMMS49938_00080 [Fibrobacterales bacterium]
MIDIKRLLHRKIFVGVGLPLAATAVAFFATPSLALDPLYDYRYTLGPEILVPDAFFLGIGGWTHRYDDGSVTVNAQLGLNESVEIGAKFIIGTNDEWVLTQTRNRSIIPLIDVGAKYAISPHLVLQADVPIALNKDKKWGGVLTLSQWDGYTKNVSFLMEGRLGFGGAAGENENGDNPYAKAAFSFTPYFQIGDAFRISVTTISSASAGNFEDDFMLDILPRVEAGFSMFRLNLETSIAILTWKAEKFNRYALFILTDI